MAGQNPFLNRPNSSYIPLGSRPVVISTREIRNTGRANKQEFFLLTRPWTIREKATIDLLYPTPDFVRNALNDKKRILSFTRITVGGNTRITVSGEERVTAS